MCRFSQLFWPVKFVMLRKKLLQCWFVYYFLHNIYLSREVSCTPVPVCDIATNWRIDCYPETVSQVQEVCESRGCCYDPVLQFNDGIPWCFYPSNYPAYEVIQYNQTSYGYSGVLNLISTPLHPFGPLISKLSLDVFYETNERIRFRIRDMKNARYEVPIDTPNIEKGSFSENLYNVKIDSDRFGIVISRKSSGIVIFNTTIAPLIYGDQFLQISTALPTKYIYGLGERHEHPLISTAWQRNVYWARDQPPTAGANLYGDHPVYFVVEDDGRSHGVFFLNSNAKEVLTQPAPALTWRTIGGIMDFYVFLGPTVESVVQQYTDVVGKPFLPPYWSLGFHLCRWGYMTANKTLEIVEKMREGYIPQDVQWNDIDYMKSHLDFTYDHTAFGNLPQVVDNLHKHGQHYVMILDPGISNVQAHGTYSPYDDGISSGIFIKDKVGGKPIEGKVWPGKTVFPDFTHPGAEAYWEKQLRLYHAEVPFDGAWVDMNEPSNFVDGSTSGCPNNKYENPVYVPHIRDNSLSVKTLCASAAHYNTTHYDVHSLTGLLEMKATNSALKKIRGKRPFIISRSTFPSAGKYGGHWNGDVTSTWADMKQSIASIINFNLFGVPMVGADICGFSGDTTEELCTRWMQLGAFYPFSRNHNNLNSKAQAPVDFSLETQANMLKVLNMRYTFLPYLYSLFFNSHVNGGTVARGLFAVFPKDKTSLTIDEQFMWGDGLLITPVLTQGASTVNAYFPPGNWYSISGFFGNILSSSGQWITLNAPISEIPLHLRGGSIVVTQDPDTTTTKSRNHGARIVVAPDTAGSAEGYLYWDDGDSLETYESKMYLHVSFSLKNNTLTSTIINKPTGIDLIVSDFFIMNVDSSIKSVYLDGNLVPSEHLKFNVLHFECLVSLGNRFQIILK